MLPDACRQSVILVPQPNRVRTTPCYKRTYNFAVSKIGHTWLIESDAAQLLVGKDVATGLESPGLPGDQG